MDDMIYEIDEGASILALYIALEEDLPASLAAWVRQFSDEYIHLIEQLVEAKMRAYGSKYEVVFYGVSNGPSSNFSNGAEAVN